MLIEVTQELKARLTASELQVELAEKIEMGEQKKDMVLNRISIESALEKLPDELKEVIVLYYFDELKITEIAETLSVTVPLVKYRLRQAKIQLKRIL